MPIIMIKCSIYIPQIIKLMSITRPAIIEILGIKYKLCVAGVHFNRENLLTGNLASCYSFQMVG